MPGIPPNSDLDAQLRDVPLPEGFMARLRQSFELTDERLDEELRGVATPSILLTRLKDIPADERLDSALRLHAPSLPVVWQSKPVSLQSRARKWLFRVSDLAVAAALFLVFNLALWGIAGGVVSSARRLPTEQETSPFVLVYNGPLDIQSELISFQSEEPGPEALTLETESDAERKTREFAAREAAESIYTVSAPEWDETPRDLPGSQWQSAVAAGMQPFTDVVLLRYGVLGSPQSADETLPELETPRSPAAAGIEPPPVRGYDRGFFLRHHVHPPISPVASPELAEIAVPLVTSTQSFQEVQRRMTQGRWPAASDVRVEDFLAAMDYRFPPPAAGTLGIRTAAGPSVFGPAGTGLVQIAVQAGGLNASDQTPVHLILALDWSASMARGSRIDAMRQGIRRTMEQLGPEDRVSLVIFQDEVVEMVEGAAQADTEAITRLLQRIEPRGGTDLALGMQQAAALALAGVGGTRQRIVLLTDSRVSLPASVKQSMRSVLTLAANAGARLEVLDLEGQSVPDPGLVEWAALLHGDVRSAQSGSEVYWRLLEAVKDSSSVIASETKLRIRFNPRAVAAYRLIGHDANALASIRPATVETELRAGEVATALFEIWFQPEDLDDVAQVELTWKNPATRESQQLSQRISRVQFAASSGEMPLSLQQAALAAETAEQLRGSRDALRELKITPVGNWQGVGSLIAAARQAHPKLQQRADFQAYLDFLVRLEKLEKAHAP